MNRNVTIFIALASVLALGLWGQYVLSPETFLAQFPARFYEVIMLFALEGEWTLGRTLPIQLELARLLAPMVSIAGVLIVITRGTWVQLTNSLILIWRDHVVVVGLGDKGRRFALNCRSDYNVVVIEQNPENIYIDEARNRGIKVIVGDALDPLVQRNSRLRYARHLAIFTGDDGSSVELALRFRNRANRFIPDNESRPHIHVHVNDTEMARRMEDFSGFNIGDGPTETSFFSVEERIARMQFLGTLWAPAPDEFAEIMGQETIHIAIYGLNNLAEHMITEAVHTCHYFTHNQIRLTVFDPGATEKGAALLRRYPAIKSLCEIRFVDVLQIPMEMNDEIVALLPSVTEHIICLDHDNDNLAISLWLRRKLLNVVGANAPIHVRMQSSRGLATLLESRDDEPEWPDGIYPFGMLDDVLTAENILSDSLDQYAKALHEDYLASKRDQADPRLWTTLKNWETMSESARKTNRQQADHLEAKLRAVRCHKRDGDAPTYTFTREDAEQLAIMEHRRYQSQKIFSGWSGGEERTESARVNPTIGPWEDLTPDERERQISDIMRLPNQVYAHLGFQLWP
ncbi:MAG: NAD(P)-binding protein, partial [Pseudomonadota bacterium]